jgi:hypothetical protein
MKTTLALYTTVYPGVEPYLPAWFRSVQEQTDQDFVLWMGLDSITAEAVRNAVGADPKAVCVVARAGDTPAQVRQRALEQIVDAYDGVVLVDSDDTLYPSRVMSARAALEASDIAACAIRVVDQRGGDLGVTFALPSPGGPDAVLPRNNIFGLSNSSFRTAVLRRCLPIPADVVLVDWYLATLAWLLGARFRADPEIGMAYRQYGANTACVLPPFVRGQVARDTERVRQHFSRVLSASVPPASAGRVGEVRAAAAEVDAFYRQVVLRPAALDRYVGILNALEPAPHWWSCVAHPALREMWAPTMSQS